MAVGARSVTMPDQTGMSAVDYYEVLGVGRSASQSEIKAAFRKLAKESHPDLHPKDASAPTRFRAITEAYEVLSDPELKARYDSLMAEAARAQTQEAATAARDATRGAAATTQRTTTLREDFDRLLSEIRRHGAERARARAARDALRREKKAKFYGFFVKIIPVGAVAHGIYVGVTKASIVDGLVQAAMSTLGLFLLFAVTIGLVVETVYPSASK